MSNFDFEKENPEFLAVLEAVSIEKGLKKDVVNKAVESAFVSALNEYYKGSYNPSVVINRNTGAVSVFKKVLVVKDVQDSHKEISESEALKISNENTLGSEILLPLRVSGFSSNIIRHIGHLMGKEIVAQEKEVEYAHFLKLKGFLVNCTVKKVFYGGCLVSIDKFEAFIKKNDMLQFEFEKIKPGQRLEALVYEIKRDDVKPQALLTRSSPEFLFELLKQAIPEVMDETIQVKAISRDAGSRAKIALFSKDPTINPILLFASPTYMRKLNGISRDLGNEKIDIVEWNEDPGIFLVNSLKSQVGKERDPKYDNSRDQRERSPAKQINILNVTVDYDNKNIEVIVDAEHISLAIGRKGQNVRLLSKLLGWPIHFVTQEENSQNKFDQITTKASTLVDELNVDETIAQLLVIEGLDTTEKISQSSLKNIAKIEGFDDEVAKLIQDRALYFIEETKKAEDKVLEESKLKAMKLAKEIHISEEVALEFIKVGIEDAEKLGEYSVDEILEDLHLTTLDSNVISESIMKARGF